MLVSLFVVLKIHNNYRKGLKVGNIKKYSIAILIIAVGLIITQEMTVDGRLTVTDELDVSGNRITNVGDPVEETDAVNVNFIEDMMTNQGPFEYKYYFIGVPNTSGSWDDPTYQIDIKYFSMDWTDNGVGWVQKVNMLSSEGWVVKQQLQAGSSGSLYQAGSSWINGSMVLITLERQLNP